MDKPVIGGWWAVCCLHDLQHIRTQEELEEATEVIADGEFGASCWPTLADALAALEEDGDFERGMACALRLYFGLPMSDKSVVRRPSSGGGNE